MGGATSESVFGSISPLTPTDNPTEKQIELFWDEENDGFFSTAASQSDLILRLKDGMDNAEPATNGISAKNLNRLASILGDEQYSTRAKKTLRAFSAEIMQHPFLFVSMLDAVVAGRLGTRGIVVTGEGISVEQKLQEYWSTPSAGRTLVRLGNGTKSEWLRKRNELLGAFKLDKPSVQVCEGNVCKEVLDL
jgi:uncharacterized protein YyaL (SSP411 family)